jgi:hypothetical protein
MSGLCPCTNYRTDCSVAIHGREACRRLQRKGPASRRSQWCPVCKTYHVDPGEKTDAGVLTRPCPQIPADDPRNRHA